MRIVRMEYGQSTDGVRTLYGRQSVLLACNLRKMGGLRIALTPIRGSRGSR